MPLLQQNIWPHFWFRLPRRTVRLRLTLLYGALFLATGAGLLAITYFLVNRATGNYIYTSGTNSGLFLQSSGRVKLGSTIHGATGFLYRRPGAGHSPTLADLRAEARQIQAYAQQQHADELHQLVIQSGIALAIMAVVSIGLGWIVAGRVLRPLRSMTVAVREISASNLNRRLAADGPDDELFELGETFNGLLNRLEASFRTQRQFVANASHELRTPLARQRTLLEISLTDPRPTIDSLRATNERVLAAGEQQEKLIEALLVLARSERGIECWQTCDLAVTADEVLRATSTETERRGLRIGTRLSPTPVSGDPRLITRLVANLVDNAILHNRAEGHIAIVTETRSNMSVLSIANSGPGIPPEEVDRLFQPFLRLGADRTAHEGHGLGLSIVQSIATAHGATVSARARLEGGLEIEVTFPLVKSKSVAKPY